MTDEDIRTLKQLAEEALQVQNASNLSGILISYAKSFLRLRRLLEAEGATREEIQTHPIAVAWTDKIADMTGIYTRETAYKAFEVLEKIVKEGK